MNKITITLTQDQARRVIGALEYQRITTSSKEDSAFVQRIQRIINNSFILQS